MEHFLKRAAQELGVEAKTLLPDTVAELQSLEWRGNVRQLENTARWLTVMASGREIHVEDLPGELHRERNPEAADGDWRLVLRNWVRSSLIAGKVGLLDQALPDFETIMIETALEFTGGRKQDAARLLGWGRNTLTRKIKELGLEEEHREAG
jgi:two-component system nitrogen regulation response regulator GlnG